MTTEPTPIDPAYQQRARDLFGMCGAFHVEDGPGMLCARPVDHPPISGRHAPVLRAQLEARLGGPGMPDAAGKPMTPDLLVTLLDVTLDELVRRLEVGRR